MSSYVPIELTYDVTEPEKKANLNDIIFIHGLSHGKIGWKKLTKKFANHTGRRAYALDMRNHGDSEWSEDFSYDIMVKDILHFMKEKGIQQAVLIGHSMGAKLAMELALAKPERVEKLVLEDAGPGSYADSTFETVSGWLSLTMKATETIPADASYREAMKIISDYIYQNSPQDKQFLYPDSESLEIPITKKGGRYALKGNVNLLRKWIKTPGMYKASKGLCTKPALFIYGTSSPLKVKDDEELIMNIFPNAKLHAVEGGSHHIHSELPEEFCQVVLDFLSES